MVLVGEDEGAAAAAGLVVGAGAGLVCCGEDAPEVVDAAVRLGNCDRPCKYVHVSTG